MYFRQALIAIIALTTSSLANAQTGTIDFTHPLQQVEGFGFSDAFGGGDSLRKLPAASQREVLDLLFSRDKGAGFSILRLGILTDSNIEPTSPGSPTAPPTYMFDNNDGGQLWLAQQAQKYGTSNFIADAWTAPAFMKTNNSTINGGYLCGELHTPHCPTGDWRQAYADYLLQNVRFYKAAGIPIGALGFINEPDEALPYASMQFTPEQAVDFIKIIGPAIHASHLPLRLTCCDSSQWLLELPFTNAIMADPAAASFVYALTPHEYGSHAVNPQPTTKPVWMTEWSSGNGAFEPLWDCGGCQGGPDGMYLANDIIQAFNAGKVSAYVYWWGTATGPAALIQTTGATYTVAARFYAIAAISRFVRPGAYVVSSSNTDSSLNAVAFRNPDGSKVVAIINTTATAVPAAFTIDAATAISKAKTYLTDSTHSLAETGSASISGQTLSITLPPRSLTTLFLPSPNLAVRKRR